MQEKNFMSSVLKPLATTMGIIILFILLLSVSGVLFNNPTSYFGDFSQTIISELILIIGMLILGKKMNVFGGTFFTKRNLKIGTLLVIPLILFNLFVEIYDVSLNPSLAFRFDGTLLILCLISSLCIGFGEEIAFRGLIFNNLLNNTSKTKKDMAYAIAITSILFGLIHVFNASESPLFDVLQQAAYAVVAGILLNLIYAITGNLIIVGVGHGLFDFVELSVPCFYNKPYTSASVESNLVETIALIIAMTVYIAIIVRKVPIEKWHYLNKKD